MLRKVQASDGIGKDMGCIMKVENLVLGGGISGLACANELAKRKKEVVVFEEKDYIGGLCHSFEVNGFRFDSAVHLSFTNNSIARQLFDQTPFQTHLPIAYNYFSSLWMKHPILNNMYPLSVDEKVECIKSFLERDKNINITNYEKWLEASYGKVIARKFYEVYTKKYWTVASKEMSTTWIGKRLNEPDLEKVLRGAFTENTGNDYYAEEMRYPIGSGGYETFLLPLTKQTIVKTSKKAVRVNVEKKFVEFEDGSICYYERLISSIPLPELVEIMENVPDRIRDKAKMLKASRISLVSVGFNKPDIPKWLWFYIYDTDIMAARVNSPSMKSRDNVPEGCSSLQFEIYHNPDNAINREEIIDNTEKALQKMEICKPEDILFMDYRVLPYGNVIFYKGMEKDRDLIKEYLGNFDLRLIGRFGEWDYLWSDQSYLSGFKAGQEE